MNTPNWKTHYVRDRYDSADNDLRIIDASPESMSHPQGPITIATVNVRPFAPHVEHAEGHARLIAAAPALLAALYGARSALRKALPFLPPDEEAVYAGEWLDEINAVISNAEQREIIEDAEIEWAEEEAKIIEAIHSDTPRTDALYFGGILRPSVYDMAGLCKEMEREGAATREVLRRLSAAITRRMSPDEPTPEDRMELFRAHKEAEEILK